MRRGEEGIGATVMGRNVFGPVRGPWNGGDRTGWWGSGPPSHHPVLVLTHHARDPVEMAGGTTSVRDRRHRVRVRAGVRRGRDVRRGGGAVTVQQYLRAGLVDELHVAVVPLLLGGGERLFAHLEGARPLECAEVRSSPAAAHVRPVRR